MMLELLYLFGQSADLSEVLLILLNELRVFKFIQATKLLVVGVYTLNEPIN